MWPRLQFKLFTAEVKVALSFTGPLEEVVMDVVVNVTSAHAVVVFTISGRGIT